MALTWRLVDLAGVKDGANKTFTIASIGDLSQLLTMLVRWNGRTLYRVGSSPGPTQYQVSNNAIVLGDAPESSDNLWAHILYDAATSLLGNDPDLRSFYFSVELRNKSGQLLEILQGDLADIWWDYFVDGGCGSATIALKRPFDDYGDIGLDYDVQIWRNQDPTGSGGPQFPFTLPVQLGTGFTGSRELRWSGFVRTRSPLFTHDERLILQCSGYSRQLEYIGIDDQTYASMDVGAAVRSIIDTYVLPASQIKRTAALALVQDTGFTLSSTGVRFDQSVANALRQLAIIGGNAEWGVRADKELYFLPRTTTEKTFSVIGKNVSFYEQEVSTDDIVHRVYLRGRNGYKKTLDSTSLESGFGKHRHIPVSGVQTDADATLWANAFFSIYNTPQPKGRITIEESDDWFENAGHPLGLHRVMSGPQFYHGSGSALPATFTGGKFELGHTAGKYYRENFRLGSIRYSPQKAALKIDMELGDRGSLLGDYLGAIQYKLEETRQL